MVIVIGSSMKVRPVCLIPTVVDPSVPQILINREPLDFPMDFDLELLGNCDLIIEFIEEQLGQKISQTESTFKEISVDQIQELNQESNKNYFITKIDESLPNKRYLFNGTNPELLESYVASSESEPVNQEIE